MADLTVLTRSLDWAFRDRHTGRIVIAQWPNVWLWIFLAGSGVETVTGAGTIAAVAGVVARVGLVIWAGDELLRGVNPWRRFLGSAVLIGIALRLAL